MDSAFDKLDAAGFLEIWQHFDADGEDSSHDIVVFFLSVNIFITVLRVLEKGSSFISNVKHSSHWKQLFH